MKPLNKKTPLRGSSLLNIVEAMEDLATFIRRRDKPGRFELAHLLSAIALHLLDQHEEDRDATLARGLQLLREQQLAEELLPIKPRGKKPEPESVPPAVSGDVVPNGASPRIRRNRKRGKPESENALSKRGNRVG